MLKGNLSANLERQQHTSSLFELKKPAIDSKILEAMLSPTNTGIESRNP